MTPEMKQVRALDVVPHEWAVWCTVEKSQPFANKVVSVKWSEDGESLWFMLGSFNFLNAKPDEMLDLVPHEATYPPKHERVAKHKEAIAARPKKMECPRCKGEGQIDARKAGEK